MNDAKKVRILTRVGHGANDMYFFALPSVLPLILVQFGFSYTTAGGFLTAFLCTVALFSFVFGRLADRFPRWIFLATGFFVASTGLVIAGFMPRFWLFMLFILVTAVGVSTYHPVAYAVVDEGAERRRGRAFALFEISGAAGVLCLFLLHGALLTAMGWKTVILITSVPGLAVGALFIRHRRAVDVKIPATVASAGTEPAAPFAVLLLFFVSVVLRILCLAAVWNFMPTFLADGVGLPSHLASFATGFLFVGGILVNLFAGRLADRFGPVAVILGASAVSGLFIFLCTYVTAPWMLPIVLVLIGAGVSSAIPAQNLLLSRLSPSGRKGEAFGYLMGFITIANSMAPLLFGVLADGFGLRGAFRIISIPVWLSCLLLLAIRRAPALRRAPVGETG